MDGTESETTEIKNDVADTSLPAVMASLEMLTVNTNLTPFEQKKVKRRRVCPNTASEILNRRCSLRPRKRTCSEMETDSNTKAQGPEIEVNVKEYNLNKNLKKRLKNLETIYEENDEATDSVMSVKKYKRMIQFNAKPSDTKIKKRRRRIKKVFGSKINFKRRCASMLLLVDKLNSIRAESPTKMENEVKLEDMKNVEITT